MKRRTILVLAFGLVLGAVTTRAEDAAKPDSAPKPLPADFLEKGRKFYSQHDEEKLIRHFFNDAQGGFFVDIGCSHFMKNSTTIFLEWQRKWSGIGVDAVAGFGPEYAKNRPKTKFFNYIVTDHSGTKDKFYEAGWVSSTNADHVNTFELPNGMKPKEIEVPTITLNQLLDREGVKAIDLLSLDIELGEPAALRGFDIDRFKPRLVVIEAGNTDMAKFIQPYFAEHGYERIEEYLKYDNVNWYYKPKAVP